MHFAIRCICVMVFLGICVNVSVTTYIPAAATMSSGMRRKIAMSIMSLAIVGAAAMSCMLPRLATCTQKNNNKKKRKKSLKYLSHSHSASPAAVLLLAKFSANLYSVSLVYCLL